MSKSTDVIVTHPGEVRAFSAVGDVYRILATGEQTRGAYALMEARVWPGGGPPPHFHHREDQAFYMLEGELEFSIGKKQVAARAGTFLQAPRGVPHAYKNVSAQPARILIQVTPAGFERFLLQLAHPLPSFASPPVPVTPEHFERLHAIAPKHGIEILLPPH